METIRVEFRIETRNMRETTGWYEKLEDAQLAAQLGYLYHGLYRWRISVPDGNEYRVIASDGPFSASGLALLGALSSVIQEHNRQVVAVASERRIDLVALTKLADEMFEASEPPFFMDFDDPPEQGRPDGETWAHFCAAREERGFAVRLREILGIHESGVKEKPDG